MILLYRILTKDNLALRGVLSSTDMSCAFGCNCNETVNHLFLQCTLSTDLWALVWNWLGISFVHAGELRQHFLQFTRWRVCQLILIYSSQLFGLLLFGCFGRKRTIGYLLVQFPIILFSLKMWSFTPSFGLNRNRWLLPILCMGVLLDGALILAP